ncbi:MAG: ABC transporter permease [Cyanobacteria bacterium REEB67]|nr:ABC transporter permease [Cyanobacteria bacterium REEB67]
MYVPIFVLIVYSFDNSRLAVEWTGFTTHWYQTLFKDESIGIALKNSLLVATIAVAASTVMGTMAAVGLARARFAGKSLMSAMIILPIIVPEIAMAVSALILFISMGVSLGLASVIVAHIIFCLSYVALTVMARLEGMNEHLNEAALDLGASPWQAFYKVTLPLIAPGILSGALLAFVLSLDDFVITQFTAGVGATTLPLRIYSMVKFGVSPEINALSTLMLLVTICVTVTAEIIRQRSQTKSV